MNEVTVLCRVRTGIIFYHAPDPKLAYDRAKELPDLECLKLWHGINDHIPQYQLEVLQSRAAQHGLKVERLAQDHYVVLSANDAENNAQRPHASAATSDGTPTLTALERALASDRVVSLK
jgi:hypothetical protein